MKKSKTSLGLDKFVGMFANNPIAKKYVKLSWNQLTKTPEWKQAEIDRAKEIMNYHDDDN